MLTACGASSRPVTTTLKFEAGTGTLRDAAVPRGVLIGAAAATEHFVENDYRNLLSTEFSQLTPEWEMKFATVHPRPNSDPNPYDFSRCDQLMEFAADHHMQVRGHTLIWHEALPPWIRNGGASTPQLAFILRDHMRTVLERYRGKVYAWDIVNEAFNDDGSLRSTLWYNQPGIGYAGRGSAYIEQALVWARQIDSDTKLFYNDYGTETFNRKSDAMYAMARDFKMRGVPLDGIGFQMHISLSFDNDVLLRDVARNLKRFSDLGLEIHITELDIRLTSDTSSQFQQQASLYSKIANLCLENPNCKVLQTWGFTDRHSWLNGETPGKGWPLLWDVEYAKKPAYYGVLDALSRNPQ